MAFFSRAGSILRQSVSKHINHEMSVASPSIFQMIRCMSSSKVFVGGLAWATDDKSLREAFSAYGEVHEARVIMDRDTGRSKGFGFVTFADSEAASSAIQAMDQRELHGRKVRVNYANDRTQGGGGYGGGYGLYSYGFGDVAGTGGYGTNSYGSRGDVAGSGGYGGNNYGSAGGDVGGESQDFDVSGGETQDDVGGGDFGSTSQGFDFGGGDFGGDC